MDYEIKKISNRFYVVYDSEDVVKHNGSLSECYIYIKIMNDKNIKFNG